MPSEQSDAGTYQIEVSERVYQRFEEEREKTKTQHVPEMGEELFLSALLDTHEAVGRGYYSDDRL